MLKNAILKNELYMWNPIPWGSLTLAFAPHIFHMIPSIVTLWQDTKCNPPLYPHCTVGLLCPVIGQCLTKIFIPTKL